MSEENVQAFCAKADTDEALGNKLAHVEPGDGALDQVVKIAAEAGFDVTASEIISVGRAALSDEELESVAGGFDVGPVGTSPFKELRARGFDAITCGRELSVRKVTTPLACVVLVRHQARWK